jgi:hypothetical protein
MADIQELIDSRQYKVDRFGKEAATRVFRVLQVSNEIGAKNEFNRLADSNQFPGASAFCVLDSVSVEGKNGNTVFIVTANYSSFGGFLAPRDDTVVDSFFGWGYRKVTVKLPFLYQGTITTSSGETEGITNLVWFAKTVDIVETRLLRTYKLKYKARNSNELDVIAQQDRKLHLINGEQYLFNGADVQQDSKDPRVFIITYTWELDKGTFARASPKMKLYISGDSAINFPTIGSLRQDVGILCGFRSGSASNQFVSETSEHPVLIRSPYTTVDLAGAEAALTIPKPTGYMLYDYDDEGWKRLPGINLIPPPPKVWGDPYRVTREE